MTSELRLRKKKCASYEGKLEIERRGVRIRMGKPEKRLDENKQVESE